MKVGAMWCRARAGSVVVSGGPKTRRIICVEAMPCGELGDGGGDGAGMGGETAFYSVNGFTVVGCLTGKGRGVGDGDILCSYLLPH